MEFDFRFPKARVPNERGMSTLPEFQHDGRIIIDTGPSRAGGHQMEAHETCPRMVRLLQEMRARGEVTKENRFYLNRGSLVHIGCAHYHAIRAIREQGQVRVGDLPAPVTDEALLYPPIEAVHVGADLHPEWRGSLKESLELTERYITWADANPNPWDTLGVEVEVGILLYEGEVYTARLDMLVRDRATKRIHAVDHKTSYYPRDVPTEYGHTWQVIGVGEIGRELYGERWGGLILNAIASAPNVKIHVLRAPPDPAPALSARFRTHAVAQRRELRRQQGLPVSEAPIRLSSCRRPRQGTCPVYAICSVHD